MSDWEYNSEAYPLDFAIRLDDLFDSCVEGGEKPEHIKAYLIKFLSEFPSTQEEEK